MGSLPAVRSESGLVPGNVSELLEMAAIAVKSGLLPRGVDTKEKAALIMLKGHELGITTMQSFESLFVVYGRVGMDTKLMATLLRRAGHDYRVIERTPERAVVDLYLKQDRTVDGWPARRFVLTMEEAKAARWHMEKNTRTGQWQEKATWNGMPARMLLYRCLSSAIRLYAPECLFGLHTLDELDGGGPEPAQGAMIVEDLAPMGQEDPAEPPVDGDFSELPGDPEPEPQPAPTPKAKPAPWTRDKAKAAEFMQAAADHFGLSYPEIFTALGVESIEQVTCSMTEARAQLETWLNENVYQVDESAEGDDGAELPQAPPAQAPLV